MLRAQVANILVRPYGSFPSISHYSAQAAFLMAPPGAVQHGSGVVPSKVLLQHACTVPMR